MMWDAEGSRWKALVVLDSTLNNQLIRAVRSSSSALHE
jgi:hypothetical protein